MKNDVVRLNSEFKARCFLTETDVPEEVKGGLKASLGTKVRTPKVIFYSIIAINYLMVSGL